MPQKQKIVTASEDEIPEGGGASGRWTAQEHNLFLMAYSLYKNNWKIAKNKFLSCKINNKIIKIKKRFIK